MPDILSPEQLTELGGKLQKILDGQKVVEDNHAKVDATLKELQNGVQTVTGDVAVIDAKLKRQTMQVAHTLSAQYGPSGAQDWLGEMSKFVAGIYHQRHGLPVPESCKMSGGVKHEDLWRGPRPNEQKAAADFTTGTSSAPYAGYVLPEILRPGLIPLRDIYGNVYPRLTKFTCPPGVNVYTGKIAAKPTATWRSVQVSTLTEEATPLTFGRGTINTILLGTYIQISNELLSNPAINFGAIATTQIVAGINRAIEIGVLQGDDSAGPPSDGLLVDSGVYSQTAIATASFANVVSFLQECVADNSWSLDNSNQILVTPRDILALASQAVGTSELTGMLVWGDPRKGIPTSLLGFEILKHPAMKVSTTYYAALCDLASILLGEDAALTVDINPYLETAFKENASWLRVLTHADWDIGQPTECHKCVVTA